MELSIWVEQDFTYQSGLRDSHRFDIASGTVLAHFHARGGIWIVARLCESHFGDISLRAHRVDYPNIYPIYGTSNPHEPIGENVRVTLELNCWADADYYLADARIGCPHPDHYVKVRQITLDGLD